MREAREVGVEVGRIEVRLVAILTERPAQLAPGLELLAGEDALAVANDGSRVNIF